MAMRRDTMRCWSKRMRMAFQFKVKDSMGQRFDRWLRRPDHVEDKAKYDKVPRNLKAQFRTAWGQDRHSEYQEVRKHL